jgi:hypothetical protein
LEIARFFGIRFESPLIDDGDFGIDGEIRRGLPDLSEQDKKDMLGFMRVRRSRKWGRLEPEKPQTD